MTATAMNQTSPAASLSNKRILVVEDMALVAQEIELILKRAECTIVGPAARLNQAMEMLDDAAFDGVILDVNLDGVESYPFADELQARGIPFVLTTGYDAGSIPARYQNRPRLEKPFGVEDLMQAVGRMFAG